MHKAGFCAMITLLLENTSRKQSRNFWKPARSISCNTNMQQQQKQQQQQKAATTTITDTHCNCMIDIFPNNQCNISYSLYQSRSSHHDCNHNKSKLLSESPHFYRIPPSSPPPQIPLQAPPRSSCSSLPSFYTLYDHQGYLSGQWQWPVKIVFSSMDAFSIYGAATLSDFCISAYRCTQKGQPGSVT